MGELNKQAIDYDKVYRFMKTRGGQDLMDEKERKQMDEEQKIVEEKMAAAEKSRPKVEFMNYGSGVLMASAPPDVVLELGIRVFTGSRDVPKDMNQAYELIQAALHYARIAVENGGSREELGMALYY